MQEERTRSDGHRRPVFKPKTCVVCGVEFMPNVGHQKYCGPACRLEAAMVDRTCEQCGKTFRAEFGMKGRRFCSQSCASKVKRARYKGGVGRFGQGSVAEFPKPALCGHCGEPFEQNTRGQKYCSRRCNMQARHQRQRDGKQTWSLKSKGEKYCRNCGDLADHLHHIVPRSKSRIPTHDVQGNGLPLCHVCHRGWHDRCVTIPHRKLTDQEFATSLCFGGGSWTEFNYPDEDLTRLWRIDEIMNRRVLVPDRPESFDERGRRIREEWEFPAPMQRTLPQRQLEFTINDKHGRDSRASVDARPLLQPKTTEGAPT